MLRERSLRRPRAVPGQRPLFSGAGPLRRAGRRWAGWSLSKVLRFLAQPPVKISLLWGAVHKRTQGGARKLSPRKISAERATAERPAVAVTARVEQRRDDGPGPIRRGPAKPVWHACERLARDNI